MVNGNANASFDVYVIHSNKPLDELKHMLETCGGYVYAGIIYKSLHRNTPGQGPITEKEETRKTIVFCPESTVKQLEETYQQYAGRVADYNWGSFPMPNLDQGETWDLHISGVPKDYTVKDAEALVCEHLSCILPEKNEDGSKNFVVEFTPRLRETGEIYGFGHIIFDKAVDRTTVKMCKIVLHNTPISYKNSASGGGKRMITCVWHRPTHMVRENRKPVRSYPRFEGVTRGQPVAIKQVDISELDNKQEEKLSSPK